MYNNFELYNPFITLDLIVWSLFAGFVAAALLAVYTKRVVGGFVRTLLKSECFSEESAKTLSELGFGTNYFIQHSLRTDAALRKLVFRANGLASNGTIDFLTAEFYIPEEKKYRAEIRYAGKGTGFVDFVICVVILAAAAFAALYLIPDLIQLIDNFITQISSSAS